MPVSIIATSAADRITWMEAEVPTLHVSSPSGIGSARLLTRDGEWPSVIDVTLDLKALEGFTVRSGNQVHRLELLSEGRVLLEPSESALHLQPAAAGVSGAGITVRITPSRFAGSVSELYLEWVDYYR